MKKQFTVDKKTKIDTIISSFLSSNKDSYLKYNLSEIIIDIKKNGFQNGPGESLSQDLTEYINLNSDCVDFNFRSGETTEVTDRFGIIDKKIRPWFEKHDKYQEAIDMFLQGDYELKSSVLSNHSDISNIQPFIVAASCGLLERIGHVSKASEFTPSAPLVVAAKYFVTLFESSGFKSPTWILGISSYNKATTSPKSDIVKIMWKTLDKFYDLERNRRGSPISKIIKLLVEFYGIEITLKTVQINIKTSPN